MSRISLQEVAEIAQLASQRRAVVHGAGPTLDGVAQALGLPPAQVQSLLQEVRGEPADLAGDGDQATFRRSLIGLAAAAGVLVLMLLWSFIGGAGRHPGSSRAQPAVASAPGANVSGSLAQAKPPPAEARNLNGRSNGAYDPGVASGGMALGSEYAKDASTDLNHAVERARRQNAANAFAPQTPAIQ